MELRPYQSALIDRVRASFQSGHRAPLMVAPTGSGKTVMFCAFVKLSLAKRKRILILAHRSELLDQIGTTLRQFNVPHGFIAPGRYMGSGAVQVGSVFSVVRRTSRMKPPDLVIIDEAHHGTLKSTWGRVMQAFPRSFRIGVTATPQRLSGEPLGDLFDDLIIGPTIPELVALGSLSSYRLWAPPTMTTDGIHTRGGDYAKNELAAMADKPTITGNAVDHYRKHADGKRAVAFCVSIAHAQHVAAQFAQAGISSASVDGAMDQAIRARTILQFTQGVTQVLTSCDLISEGFDCPSIECAILLRPTQSLTLHLQQMGRALRPYPGKAHALLLDHAGNVHRHGLPDDDREWTLAGSHTGAAAQKYPVRICAMCFGATRGSASVCPYCGAVFPVKPREVEQRAGELQEVDGAQLLLRLKNRQQGMARTVKELHDLAVSRKYKRPWAWAHMIAQARQRKKMEVR